MSPAENKRIRLGEMLLHAGVITEAQLRAALAEQKKWGGRLGSLLVEMGFLSEDMLVKALSKQLGLPRVDFEGLVIPKHALDKVDASFAEQHQVLPISLDVPKNQLIVAMSDPEKLKVVDEIAFKTGARVRVAIAGERALAGTIRKLYFGEDLSDKPGGGDDDSPMKLLNPLGNTMVRRLDSIKPQEPRPETVEAPPPPPAGGVEERISRIEVLQRKQLRVLKVVVERLIEKGIITREEYREKLES